MAMASLGEERSGYECLGFVALRSTVVKVELVSSSLMRDEDWIFQYHLVKPGNRLTNTKNGGRGIDTPRSYSPP